MRTVPGRINAAFGRIFTIAHSTVFFIIGMGVSARMPPCRFLSIWLIPPGGSNVRGGGHPISLHVHVAARSGDVCHVPSRREVIPPATASQGQDTRRMQFPKILRENFPVPPGWELRPAPLRLLHKLHPYAPVRNEATSRKGGRIKKMSDILEPQEISRELGSKPSGNRM